MAAVFYSNVILFLLLVTGVIGDIHNYDGKNEFRPDYTYYPQVGYWFKVHSVPVDWHTARLLCHYEGAELASPLNAAISEIIEKIVATHEPKPKVYFSGVHQTFGSGVYTSIEGIPLEKLYLYNWADGEPNGLQNQQCLVYSNDKTVWAYNCLDPYPYICYRKYSESDKLTECGTIDPAYQLNQQTGHCYKYHKRADTWERALKICRAEGGYLAIVNSAGEAYDLLQLVRTSSRPRYTWFPNTVALGFREWGQENAWWTIHGQTLEEAGFENWCEQCPDNGGVSKKSCGGLTMGKLEDIWCEKPYAFICEKTTDSLNKTTSQPIY